MQEAKGSSPLAPHLPGQKPVAILETAPGALATEQVVEAYVLGLKAEPTQVRKVPYCRDTDVPLESLSDSQTDCQ
jgi:hypothetical protein